MRMIDEIGETATLELLAEECVELAHAALKLARKYRKENPTPVSEVQCKSDIMEEMADVSLCMEGVQECRWASTALLENIKRNKMKRMENRLAEIRRNAPDFPFH